MDIKPLLLNTVSPTYAPYYNGKMSYTLRGKDWDAHVSQAFPNLDAMTTSENVFRTVVDVYAESLRPDPDELQALGPLMIPLLCRGQAPAVITREGQLICPEHYEMVSDGDYTMAAIFTRSLREGLDYCTFASTDGVLDVWAKAIPDDLGPADRSGYAPVESSSGHLVVRLALDGKGMGPGLASLQDRINHSIIDQTIIAEMYARPFWYLLNTQLAPVNPYLPEDKRPKPPLSRGKDAAGGRVFTTSSSGPFGQLTPPTLNDVVAYHESLIAKVSQTTGIPEFYMQGGSTPPSGVALRTLSKRFHMRVARMRDDLEPALRELATTLGVGADVDLWSPDSDLLQEALDEHGIALAQMGYPLGYIASEVTPGVNLDDYEGDEPQL